MKFSCENFACFFKALVERWHNCWVPFNIAEIIANFLNFSHFHKIIWVVRCMLLVNWRNLKFNVNEINTVVWFAKINVHEKLFFWGGFLELVDIFCAWALLRHRIYIWVYKSAATKDALRAILNWLFSFFTKGDFSEKFWICAMIVYL